MSSKRKKQMMLSYKDLLRPRITGEPRQQVKKGDPEWEDGIKCIKAYHSQATMLSQANRQEMRDIIRSRRYVITPSAKDTPSRHTLMKSHKKSIKRGRAPSWPIFVILNTLYGPALPREYKRCIGMAFGTTEVKDHTHEYLALDGAEPAEPAEPATTEEDHQTSPWKYEILDDKTKISGETKKRDAPALDIEDGSSSANKRAKVADAESVSLTVQMANAVSEQQTAEEGGCECTIGKLWEMIDKKFEAMREDFEMKEKEKFEVQTKELQVVMREVVRLHGEALMRLAEMTWQRPTAPQNADV
ncbi:hypothetical protein T069G_08801 [Trichoderma breve]|uniref:Uncharacterized protein n=1 Tax=Trichoderma breve TaxID=2034170 RepID=A0A9W9BAT8_9HYPO|nr:hypothetical protein T069G_08801 [Trichoderma breve]KAJ4857904.1 hypothetical protein T069G_08801 [Trichoderma breve]